MSEQEACQYLLDCLMDIGVKVKMVQLGQKTAKDELGEYLNGNGDICLDDNKSRQAIKVIFSSDE